MDHINTKIRKELLGMNVLEQVQIDRKLVELDGTDNKGNLGYAENMTKDLGGAKIYFKREDLNHTGAHKINNLKTLILFLIVFL